MLYFKPPKNSRGGFTLLELLVVLAVLGIVVATSLGFFTNSINQYLNLQREGMEFGDLLLQSQRITNVLRGLTDITEATSDNLKVYAYFSPNDTYVSSIRYYKNADKTTLLADVTPMTANPPIGTPIASQLKTYAVIENFFNDTNVKTFEYLDSGSSSLSLPIADLHTIKGIRVTLSVPTYAPVANKSTSISTQVSLRNRKTNL
jgi:prepilin-type N-terminal cleavage/methylation domain-containing protein